METTGLAAEWAGGWGVDNARAVAGLFVIVAAAWMLGAGWRRRPPLTLILAGLGLQFAVAVILFAFAPMKGALMGLAAGVEALQAASQTGAAFVFGYVAGGPAPFDVVSPQNAVSLAFQLLPIIMLVSAVSAVLWRWRILPLITGAFAAIFRHAMGLSGATSLATAANIFMGMVEAPILIRPYLARMNRSDLFIVMTAGLSTVAGTVLVIYAVMLRDTLPDAAGHIVAASLMSAPAAILIARLMEPPGQPDPAAPAEPEPEARVMGPRYASTMDALARGVTDGLSVYLNVIAMLLTFTALVALVNAGLTAAPDVVGAPVTVERAFGWLFQPVVWIIGVPWAESGQAGALFGIKTALNEFLAFDALARSGDELSARTSLIMAYALCGFANFGSLGIMLAGLTTMAPERRELILALGPKSLVSGTLATLMTGAVAGAFPGAIFGV